MRAIVAASILFILIPAVASAATPPDHPTSFTSTSHTVDGWSDDNTIDIVWSGATDDTAVDGYSILWDTSSTSDPDTTIDVDHTADPHTATSPALTDGDSHYCHLRTCDAAGNWTSSLHLGPFKIDTIPPTAPTGLCPANDVVTNDLSPTLSWDAPTDTVGSGLRTTNTYRVVVTGPVNKNYYTANTTYTPTLTDGVFKWKIYARDNAGNNSDWSSEYTLTIDTDPPGISYFHRQAPPDQYTNADTLLFRADFDEPVANVDATDFSIDGGTTATITNVLDAEQGEEYEITVSGGDLASFNGTVGLDLAAGQDMMDLAGNPLPAGEPPRDEPYTVDNVDPTDPTPSSGSHTVNVVSNDSTVDIENSGASDPTSNGVASGVDGFDVAWDQNATWTATEVKDQEETWAGGTFTATSDGGWYFHIATVDNAGNWTSTEDLGPFPIDTDPPAVSDVTVSDTLISDTDTLGTFTVTVVFDEDMDSGRMLSLVFSPNVAGEGRRH